MLKEAMFYEHKNNSIQCYLCPHNCLVTANNYGKCAVRLNKNNKLNTVNYGEITAIAIDPIEKKPLYHFMPGHNILSVGSYGCNFSCLFCQNYQLAKQQPASRFIEPQKLAEICNQQHNNIGLAFTYNEPTVCYEYVYSTVKIIKRDFPHLKVVLVSNGFINLEPLQNLLPYIDAMNIDLKAFNNEFMKDVCGGKLEPVLKSIELANKYCHVEITTLLVNGLNDSLVEIEKIAKFLKNINIDIPLHLTRYFPNYKLNIPATDLNVLINSKQTALKYLNYVYIGNVANINNSTYCPKCGELIIERDLYNCKIHSGVVCKNCSNKLAIYF
ncbi:AmmeMemoRadiSam system radical SAM enzyme [Clostridium sp. 'deep sea']|uniref:AmmeMemoRadiSam system radical SAM enzyme n=1 Tax=Clostridium sp. 'deep sea' TaxID=2779445 RepID=UPI0018967CEA|nr:AmmeMemoRadiSam system radical SAM enzyme [Clostridium sp. 'deep sea']QOR35141.1 AmmeMemoRadiSam system radical SAM enzyme [Clostridium sp. 'deep sea']